MTSPRLGLFGTFVALMRGGGEAYVLNLASELDRAGWDVTVVYGHSLVRRPLSFSVSPSVRLITRPYLWELRELTRIAPSMISRVAYSLARRFHARAIRDLLHRFDIVHLFTVESAEAADRYRRPGQALVLSLWGRPSPVDRPLLHRMDAVVPTSEILATWLEAQMGVTGEVIPSGVDLETFRPLPRDEARRRLGWGPEPRILYVGRLIPVKNLTTLLQAFRLFRDASPSARLVLTGHGILERRLRREARSLGVDDAVEFAGLVPREELLSQYSGADALVLPSSYETFPLVVLEALACECPVVVTEGAEEIPKHFPEVSVVPRDSAEEMAKGIGEVLRYGQPRVSRERLEEFSWERIASKYLALYQRLSGTRGS